MSAKESEAKSVLDPLVSLVAAWIGFGVESIGLRALFAVLFDHLAAYAADKTGFGFRF
jgi:hypothetical protein